MLWLTITIPRTLFKLASGGLGHGAPRRRIRLARRQLPGRPPGRRVPRASAACSRSAGRLRHSDREQATGQEAIRSAPFSPASRRAQREPHRRRRRRRSPHQHAQVRPCGRRRRRAAVADPTGGAAAAAHAATAAEVLTSAAEETAGSGQSTPAPQPATVLTGAPTQSGPGGWHEDAIGPVGRRHRPTRDADNPIRSARARSVKPANQRGATGRRSTTPGTPDRRRSARPTAARAAAGAGRAAAPRTAPTTKAGQRTPCSPRWRCSPPATRSATRRRSDLMTVARAGTPRHDRDSSSASRAQRPGRRTASPRHPQASALPGAGTAPQPSTPASGPRRCPKPRPAGAPETSADRADP